MAKNSSNTKGRKGVKKPARKKVHVIPQLSAGNRPGMSKTVARALDAHAERLHELEKRVPNIIDTMNGFLVRMEAVEKKG